MVTRTQIDRLSSRIEALAAQANCSRGVAGTKDDPREQLKRRIELMAERMRAAAESEGEPFPPPLSREERGRLVRRFGEWRLPER